MCFSATASFTAGAVLLGVGALTLRSANQPREIAFAAIPMLFALQQLVEGGIWLTFQHNAAHLNSVLTHVYSFFSHVLWPVYVPVAVLLIEPLRSRRQALRAFVAGGIGVGAKKLHRMSLMPRLNPSNVIGTIFPSNILRIRSVDWLCCQCATGRGLIHR